LRDDAGETADGQPEAGLVHQQGNGWLPGDRGGGCRGGRRDGFHRKKVCRFCSDQDFVMDYKDIHMMQSFITEHGKIVPRRISGNCATHQRSLTSSVKRARNLALVGYDRYYFAPDSSNTPTYTLRLEITINDKDKTQIVQDYLVTTAPKGAVSPQAGFSEAKRKELESQARDEATKDARKKADQSAKNLGFSVGKVKSVSDGAGFGGVMPMYAEDSIKAVAPVADSTLPVRSGQNEISYGVSVTYFLK
jgi:small subunit ribosomal protein S18